MITNYLTRNDKYLTDRVIKTDLLTIETVRASLIFSSHPGDGPTHHLLYIGDFRQQGEHGEEIQSLRLIRIREVIRDIKYKHHLAPDHDPKMD